MFIRGIERGKGLATKGYRRSFGGDRNVPDLRITCLCVFIKTHQTVHLKKMNFSVYNFTSVNLP